MAAGIKCVCKHMQRCSIDVHTYAPAHMPLLPPVRYFTV